jgi:hypothetical protein
MENCDDTTVSFYKYKLTGPLLNPALAVGQMILSFQFSHVLQYAISPFLGSALALVFYEFVFVKSQEYLNADDDNSEGDNDDLANGLDNHGKG